MKTDPKNSNASRAQSHPELTATDNNPPANGYPKSASEYRKGLFYIRRMLRWLNAELKRHERLTRQWNDPRLSVVRIDDIREIYEQVEMLLSSVEGRADRVERMNHFATHNGKGADNE